MKLFKDKYGAPRVNPWYHPSALLGRTSRTRKPIHPRINSWFSWYWDKTIIILLVIWFVATAFNITKAVHIDDTAYLSIAENILANPLHPMSGMLNWEDEAKPIYKTLNPITTSYIFAATISLFGRSEIALHLVHSLFTLAAIVFFYLLAKHFVGSWKYLFTAMFILGPSILPAQNLMSDIPALSLWLAFFWLLLCPTSEKDRAKRYIFAALTCGFAILIKYSSFFLLPILIVDIMLRKKWRYIFVLAIPVFIVIGWSIFNFLDYGKIHLLSSQNTAFDLYAISKRFSLWLVTLGAVAPFSLIFIPKLISSKKGGLLIIACLAAAELSSFKNWEFANEPQVSYFLRKLFFANGLFVLSLVIGIIFKKLYDFRSRHPLFTNPVNVPYLILFLWFLGGSVLVIFFVPFIAVRHLIGVVPAILLILGLNINIHLQINKRSLYAGFCLTVGLGMLLALSDWVYADVYRASAPMIIARAKKLQHARGVDSTVWFGGHWGWQWYAGKIGMRQYDSWNSKLENGDYLVMPLVERQWWIKPENWAYLVPIDKLTVVSTPMTFVRLMTNWPFSPAGFYAVGEPQHLPWTISNFPLEEFTIYEFKKT